MVGTCAKRESARWRAEKLQLKLSEHQNEKTQPVGWVFIGRTAESSGYPAEMWGSGRRARDVMPVAWRAALLSCWKSVAFIGP